MSGRRQSAALVLVLALLTASCWWAWLAWDSTYQVDPITGNASGPYEAWQVIGCVLSLVAIGCVAALRLPAWVVITTMTVAFTAAWTATAQSQDETGLFMVGAVLVFVGMACASGILVALVQSIARRRRPRMTT
ncbi:MAG: hypothetical protein ABIP45_07525 [Knoellia sp.]